MKTSIQVKPKPTVGKVLFPMTIRTKICSFILLRSNLWKPMATGYTIWQAMFGNGVRTGITMTTTKHWAVKPQAIHRDPREATTHTIPILLKRSLEEDHFCATIPIVRDTGSLPK